MMTSHWPMAPLSEVLTHNTVYIDAPEPREYPKLSLRLYGKGVVLDAPADGMSLKMKRHQLAKSGQVILSEIWGKKGAIGFVPTEGAGALCTSHFFLFDVNQAKIERGWLQAIFTANHLTEQLGAQAFGTTGYAAVRPKHLLSANIPLPPLEEQRRIVTRIEYFGDKVGILSRPRAASDECGSALISAVTSEIWDSLANCKKVPIGQLGQDGSNTVQTGPFGAQLHRFEFMEDGVPVLNVGNVWPEGLRLDYLDHVSREKALQLSRYALKVDDLLFARSGATLGKVCVVSDNCEGWLMTGHLFRVRFDQKRCLPAYAFAVLRGSRNARDQIFGQIRGATRPGFNTILLSRVEIPLPSIEQQKEIIARLERLSARLEQVRTLHKRTSAEFDALLPSLLDRAFAGEL